MPVHQNIGHGTIDQDQAKDPNQKLAGAEGIAHDDDPEDDGHDGKGKDGLPSVHRLLSLGVA